MKIERFILLLVMAAVFSGTAVARADDLTESPDGPEHVIAYLDLDEALDKVFAKADTLWSETWDPPAAERQAMEFALGWRLPAEPFVFHRARRGNKDLGYAMVDEQRGRFKPITFMVMVKPDGSVGRVEVLVYRESRGDGVRRQRFLKQFRGKDSEDPVRINRDITVLSGATLSSRALTAGVKKALFLVQRRYLNE